MSVPFLLRLALLALGGLAQSVALAQSAAPAAVPTTASAPALPAQDLTGSMLYEFLLGEIAGQRGEPELAAQTYLALARRTRDPRVARRAMELAGAARMQALALEAAMLWHDIEPSSSRALQTVTALLIGARRLDDAEPYLAKLIAARETSPPNAFLQIGRLLGRHPDHAAVLRVVRRLADGYPDLPEARFAVAQAAYAAAERQEALEALRKAAQMRPDWEAVALFEAQILQRTSPDEAIARLGAFLERNPQSREARLGYARLLVVARRYPQARAQFERLLAAYPGNAEVIHAVGLLAFQLKDYPLAEANLKRLLTLEIRDRDSVRFTLGQVAEEQKDWSRAIQWYEEIVAGDQFLPARLRIANAMFRQGRLGEAREYIRAIKVNENQDRVQLVVAEAQLLREANRHDDAFDLLGQALVREPDQPELLYDIALTAEKLERFDVLESHLRKLIQKRPEHAHAYNALGYSLADRNVRLDEARKLIEKALELSPEDAFIIDSMGWVLYRQGDMKGAIEQLQRAYRARPDAEIGAHLGEVLWVSGAREEANRIWDESLKGHPDNDTLRKTVERLRR
ncbi:MAG TPA: tetratricopeptide repeat protein [Burkholderiales bacterium]